MALLNAVNTASQTLVANGLVNYTTNTVFKNCGITHVAGSNTVSLKRAGVYLVTVNADVVPTAAGLVSLQLLDNNVLVPGAKGSFTGTAGDTENVSFTTLVRVLKSCAGVIDNTANLQVQVTAGVTLTNANISVVQVA